MTRTDETSTNIVLVGVAGVGKTTMGRAAAIRMGWKFFDGDLAFEESEGAVIDDLLSKYGDTEYDRRLLDFFLSSLEKSSHTILSTPARLTHYKPFWERVRKSATTIHLRGKPTEIYQRQAISVRGQILTAEEMDDDFRIKEYASYHRWRVRHCGKADYTVPIIGNMPVDLDKLCELVERIGRPQS